MQLKAFLVAILAVSVFVTNSSGQFFTKTSKSIPRMGRRADNNLMDPIGEESRLEPLNDTDLKAFRLLLWNLAKYPAKRQPELEKRVEPANYDFGIPQPPPFDIE